LKTNGYQQLERCAENKAEAAQEVIPIIEARRLHRQMCEVNLLAKWQQQGRLMAQGRVSSINFHDYFRGVFSTINDAENSIKLDRLLQRTSPLKHMRCWKPWQEDQPCFAGNGKGRMREVFMKLKVRV
jgi:hypothetical protein